MTVHKQVRETIAIVGGSAAGLFTAYLLAQRRSGVRVFERAEQLAPVPRTLIVTSRMQDLLGAAGESAVVNQIRRFELFADGRAATIPLRRPDLIIERAKLICSLAKAAQKAGARLEFSRRFLTLQQDGQGLALTMERPEEGGTEEVGARVVIGADGVASKVAQAAGWPKQQTVPLIQAIVPLPRGLSRDTVRVWFVPEDTPYFYWLIPESASQGALGVIGENGPLTRAHLERFLERQGLAPISFQGARIPLYTRWIPVERRLGAGRVYLVGDAAGQVKVTTVGGIVTGLRGSLGVAEAILNGGSSRGLRSLRRELDLHLLIRRILHRFTQDDYSRLLHLLNARACQPLSEYTRDEADKVLLHLCLRQPRLLLLGLRALLADGGFPHSNGAQQHESAPEGLRAPGD